MSTTDFYRIQKLPPYVFEEVNRLKAHLRHSGRDVIDFGMGNPDMPTPSHIIDKLIETAGKPKTNRYSASRGIPGLRKAICRYYESRFGVKIDEETEAIATLGSKEGFANLAQAITAPGDVIIAPDPAYPIHAYGFIIAGGLIRAVPAQTPQIYLEGIATALSQLTPKPVAIVLNYPSNPTAQIVDLDFYREAVALARRYEVLILSDLAYGEIYFENAPPSILEVPGAKDVAVEINSLSKTYSMAGLRVGMAVGNARMIAALGRVKSYLDYGGYTPIQVAATAALNGPQSCVQEIRDIYRSRRDVLVESFSNAGWEISVPPASMFAWAALPEKYAKAGSVAFAKQLMQDADVAVAPGIGFGAAGEGFVRIGLVENEQRIRQAARNIRQLLAK